MSFRVPDATSWSCSPLRISWKRCLCFIKLYSFKWTCFIRIMIWKFFKSNQLYFCTLLIKYYNFFIYSYVREERHPHLINGIWYHYKIYMSAMTVILIFYPFIFRVKLLWNVFIFLAENIKIFKSTLTFHKTSNSSRTFKNSL